MHRRNFCYSLAACLALLEGNVFAEQTSTGGLRDTCARSKRRIGVWISPWMLKNPTLVEVIRQNFNHGMIGTLKWDFTSRTQDATDFSVTDSLVNFCRQNLMTMHGHNLCWNATYPKWLPQALSTGNPEDLLQSYISAVMTRYKGVITSYDVVNEPIAIWHGRDDGLYKGPWLNALGPSYIDIAFHAAAQADPSALRVLNTAHVEQKDLKARAKTLALLEGLLKRGVPVQALGMESHLEASFPISPDPDRRAFLNAVRALGLKVLITELDINDSQVTGSIAIRDAAVAACYGQYLSAVIPVAQPDWISFFSFTDERNWYDYVSGPGFTRADGLPHRPGLLDANLTPKPAYARVLAALQETCAK